MSQNLDQLSQLLGRLTIPGTWVNIAAWRVSLSDEGHLRIQKPMGMYGWQDVSEPDPSIEQALLQHVPSALLSPLNQRPDQADSASTSVRIDHI